MKQSGLTIFFAAFMTALFSACSDFGDMEIPTEELYARSFVKEFGVYDQNHTWCVATPTSITINPQSLINEVKVYSRTDGHYYYVARYTNLYKTTTITFDAPAGTTDLKLKIDGTTYYAQAGTTLTVSGGSRADYATDQTTAPTQAADGVYYTNNGYTWKGIKVALSTEDYWEWYSKDMRPILGNSPYNFDSPVTGDHFENNLCGILPENNNVDGYDTYKTSQSGITLDFMFVSTGKPFIIYPAYWYTNHTNLLGLYYIDRVEGVETVVHVPLFQNKVYGSNCIIQYKKTLNWVNNELTYNYKLQSDFSVINENSTSASWLNDIMEDVIEELNTTGKYADIQAGTYGEDDLGEDLWDELCATLFNSSEFSVYSDITLKSFKIVNNYSSYSDYSEWGGVITNTPYFEFSFTFSSEDDQGNVVGSTWTGIPNAFEVDALYLVEEENDEYYFRTKGFEVTVPEGLRFGLYMLIDSDESTGQYVYSVSSRTDDGESYACTFESPLNSADVFFAFEDAYGISQKSTYWDLNDMVFMIENLSMSDVHIGETDEVEEDEDTPYQWLICAEDLGTTDDFDFNDMIVKVETLTNGDGGEGTYTWAKFTAMAAGGTLPLYLYFDPTKIYSTTDEDKQSSITSKGLMYPNGKDENFAEFHKWFGTSGYQFSEMINTSGSSGVGGRYCTLYIDGTFSLYADAASKTNQQVTESSTVKNTLASFWIEVENSSAGDDEKQIIKPKFRSEEQGSEFNSYAPQMFVIPYSWQKASDTTPTYYRWPIERKNISDAYNTTGYTFKSWVEADLISTSTWYRYPVDGTTCRPWAGEIAPE
ncbi:MAG: hypothetical protein LIP09_08750 [Bacteroidales bacterium]|nr:hypothetical protein [Bacteroidales bacterium]